MIRKTITFEKKRLKKKMLITKNIAELEIIVISICNFKCSIPIEIPAVFHNGSNYD